MSFCLAALSGLVTLSVALAADAGSTFAVFEKRVADYEKIHNQQIGKVPKLTAKESVAQVRRREQLLRTGIQQARTTAKQGDIFTPEVAAQFRESLRTELAGPRNTSREAIRDENPTISRESVPLKVNAAYPDGIRLSTMPPEVLVHLPKLPKFLEYRFVGPDLILRDVDANMIVDYLPGVVPPG